MDQKRFPSRGWTGVNTYLPLGLLALPTGDRLVWAEQQLVQLAVIGRVQVLETLPRQRADLGPVLVGQRAGVLRAGEQTVVGKALAEQLTPQLGDGAGGHAGPVGVGPSVGASEPP